MEGEALVGFIEKYLQRKIGGDEETKLQSFLEREWREQYKDNPFEKNIDTAISRLGVSISNKYFGGIADSRGPAFFVSLRLDCLVNNADYKTVQDVASYCITNIAEKSPKVNTDAGEEDYRNPVELFSSLAWGVIYSGRQFKCDLFSKDEAKDILGGKQEGVKNFELLHAALGLIEIAGQELYRFSNDPLAEYLAPKGWAILEDEEKMTAWEAMKEVASKIDESEVLSMRGVIIGFYDLWRTSDRTFQERYPWQIDLPKFLIAKEH